MMFMKPGLCERSASNRAECEGTLSDGTDRHALSNPAFASALKIFAGNGFHMRAGVRLIPLERASDHLQRKNRGQAYQGPGN